MTLMSRSKASTLALLLATSLSFLAPAATEAQDYPNRPVRIIVPWAPGGSTDAIGRILGQRFSTSTGQQFFIDNRAGATGTIGHAAAARSAPDGYTVLLATNSTFAIAPHLYKDLPYDSTTAFAPVSLIAILPQILAAHPSLPVQSVADLIAYAKANPGKVNFSTAGVGATSHLAAELLMSMAGIKMTDVPYRGGGPSAQALLAGEVMLSFVDAITAVPLAADGRVRPLGASTAMRTSAMPTLPTVAESGLPGFASSTTTALFVPAGTPRDVIDRLHREVVSALAAPDVKDRLSAQGAEPVGSTPEELAQHQKQESEKWGGVIKSRGIKLQ